MKTSTKLWTIAVVVAFAIWLQMPDKPLMAQANLRQPAVAQNTTTSVKWTAGTLNNGGHAVTVTAGTAAVTTSKTDCTAPAYASCNFVYANSSGTVAVTATLATAMAAGNSLMAYVETSSVITKIGFPNQASTAYQVRVVQNCGTTATCANTSAGPGIIEVFGSVALTSASPSTASLTALPFTSSSSYVCTASAVGNTAAIAAAGIAITQTSGSAVTLTGPNTVTTVINYRCTGI